MCIRDRFSTVPNQEKTDLLWEMSGTFKLTDSPQAFRSCPRDCPADVQPKTCFVTNNPKINYKSLNVRAFSGTEIADFEIFENPANSFVFSEGYYLNVFQQSLSALAYNYWSTVDKLVNRDGTIFEAPSGKISTNIYSLTTPENETFGFFFATERAPIRGYIPPSFAGFPRTVCPVLPSPDGSGPGNCCNCLCELNSTTVQPEWWVE